MPAFCSTNENRQGGHYAEFVPVTGPLIPQNFPEAQKVTCYTEIEWDIG